MRILVTGASGFLGGHVVEELTSRGHAVTAGVRRESPQLAKLGARVVQLELSDRDQLRAACKNQDAIVHCAAKTGVWGPRAEYERANVAGTEHLLAIAQVRKVPRFVFTSSPAVVFGESEHVLASNDVPYAKSYLCAYAATKSRAEQLVLAANGRYGMATCALRPHLIFGARDPHLVPRVIERARAGKLVRIGDGTNRVTLCAVENAASAHALAVEQLDSGAAHAGRAYFIGQEEPVVLWDWIADLLQCLGLPPVRRSLPLGVAYPLGLACELAWKLGGRTGDPPLTRFVARQLATSHSYDMAPARRDFGYRELVSTEAATARVVSALSSR